MTLYGIPAFTALSTRSLCVVALQKDTERQGQPFLIKYTKSIQLLYAWCLCNSKLADNELTHYYYNKLTYEDNRFSPVLCWTD